jgi:hypothetical protein
MSRSVSRFEFGRLRALRIPWWSIAGVSAGVAVGALITLAVVAHHAKPAPIVVRGDEAALRPTPVPAATTRRVVFPLPVLSTHVTIDDDARDLDPPSDVLAIDLPAEASTHHVVSALAADGTRADGSVREEDGIARPEGDGYTFVAAPRPIVDDPRRGGRGAHDARPVGTVRNGFTKLR